jgi:hypothetical protein
VVALTLAGPPPAASHWSGSAMAKAAGISISSVLRELKDAIHRFLDHTNANPKPFTWTKDPNKIIAAVRRGRQVLVSIH